MRSDFGQGGVLIALDPDGSKADALSAGLIDAVHTEYGTNAAPNLEAEEGEIPAANRPAVQNNTVAQEKIENLDKQKTKGETEMSNLVTLIEEHPELSGEIEKIKSEAFAAGKAEALATVEQALPIFRSGSYPETVKNLAADAAIGKKKIETLLGTVAAFDAIREEQASKNAAEATKEIEPTPAQTPEGVSEDGEVRSDADYSAMIAEMKGG